MKLYLTAVTATKRTFGQTAVSARAIAVLANNRDEAIGKAIRIGRGALPNDDGWMEHEASGDQIDDETMRIWATAYGYAPTA